MSQVKITRRDFLRLAGVTTVGTALSACASKVVKETQIVKETVPAQIVKETVAPQIVTVAPQVIKETVAPQVIEKTVVVEVTAPPTPVEPLKESPMLADLVKAGKLPPVEQRLPMEPRVIAADSIGQYGGTIRMVGLAGWTAAAGEFYGVCMPGFYGMTNDSKLFCDMGKDLQISPDYKVFTFYSRKGLKWSDGQPFSNDDVKFWWEDVINNKDLNPSPPWPWAQAGKLPTLTILDDFSFSLTYEKSYIPLRGILTYWGTMAICFATGHPAHYMKQYHIKYNPGVVDEAKKEGFDSWIQYYNARNGPRDIKYGKYVPALTPWVVVDANPQFYSWERNPYYWGVDTVGNQLPYIDKMLVQTVNDTETHNLKVVAGEVDWAAAWTKLADMPLYMDNEDKGGYEVVKFNNVNGSDMAWWFNLNIKDPIKRKIFQDPRWNQAISYATNRSEVQDVIYLGSGVIRQAAPDESNSFYKKEWGEFCVEYSTDKANQLLDEMGLDKKGSDGFRLGPDGKRLEILVEVTSAMDSPTLAVSTLVAPQWEKVGIKVSVQDRDRTFLEAKYPTGDYECSGFHINRTGELLIYLGRLVNGGGNTYGVNEWWNWYSSNGAKGEEPPAEWKAHFKDVDDWYTAGNDAEYKTLAQKIFDFTILNYPLEIGTVGYPTQPGIISKNLRNVPKQGYMGDDVGQARSLYAESWYKLV